MAITCSGNALVQELVDAVMRWVIGSQPYVIVEQHMRDMINLGVGHLRTIAPFEALDDQTNHPVYIEEPLMILRLSSLFEDTPWTQRKTWLSKSIRLSRTTSAAGSIFEEVIMMVLMEKFGGKSTALGDVFNFSKSSSLGSRKVKLVSRMGMPDGNVSRFNVSWSSGCSDRIGFKAKSADDVLSFFREPNGKTFLFPDVYMGPDLACFFEDVNTSELILFFLQVRTRLKLDARTWLHALESITPELFYTMTVCKG